ncbi:hypothetical protein NDU88_010780, partial [Pleurodeles waltl]
HLSSADLALATVPLVRRTTTGGRSLLHLAAKTWNSLPTHLRQTTDLLTFRKLLKTWPVRAVAAPLPTTHLFPPPQHLETLM